MLLRKIVLQHCEKLVLCYEFIMLGALSDLMEYRAICNRANI